MDNAEIRTALVVSRTFWRNFLLSFGLIGPLLFWIVNFLFGMATDDYDHFGQSISDLELMPNGWIQQANFVVYGLFTFIFAFGLRKEMVSGRGATWLPLVQVINGIGLVLAGFIIHDPLHGYTRLISLLALMAGFFIYAYRFKGDPRWKGWNIYAIANAVLIVILLILFIYVRNAGGPPGMFERSVVFLRTTWAVVFTIRLLSFAGLDPINKES